MKHKIFAATIAVLLLLSLAVPVMAAPPSPDQPPAAPKPGAAERLPARRSPAKSEDQPNINDYLRNRERQRLLEAGKTAEAEALALTSQDKVLVILVEFGGTDVYTWNPGDTWDPYGRADTSEGVYDARGNLIVGDCSNIITQTQTFTYAGPLHNEIPRPESEEDRSGQSIWTEDFDPEWLNAFMFGNGVIFDYTRKDGSEVYEDFSGKSVADYAADMSGGKYHVEGDVVGWLQLPHSTQYYSADQCPGRRSIDTQVGVTDGVIPGAGTSRQLVRDALDAVNAAYPDFDWTQYDLDGNGVIDRLWIVHAGYGEEDAAVLLNRTPYGESAVWSHSSSITPAYPVGDGVSAGPYIIMPENGGIGVFAHEAGHNLGATDLYAYDEGETSAGFWALQADDWTGYPIGFEPPAVDPWHLDNWGWLEPMVINDPSQVYTVTLGQASRFPGGEGVYRGAKIVLPDGELPLAVPVWQGDYYWWGGKGDLLNAMMTTKSAIAIPGGAGSRTLSFDLVWEIEEEWDFLWIQASEDGTNWDTLTNDNTQCAHDPDWIGGLYGFPEDLCGAGLGGFYGFSPDPEPQEFDLSAYAGKSIWLRFWYMTDWAQAYTGAFVDNVKVTAGATILFADDAEAGDANWNYAAPWVRTNGVQTFTHNFYLQWRNVNDNGGYDSSLGDPRWRFGPANTGLLAWYNNNFYTDNEIYNYFIDAPSVGPKGLMLVVDSHPEPYRDPDLVALGYDNEGGNLWSRGQMRDAPFTLADTVDFTHTDPNPYHAGAQEHSYEGRPAVSSFHDSIGYYPGAEYVRRGPAYAVDSFRWVTKQWDASAVMPATTGFYPFKAPGYTGNEELRFNCTPYLSGDLAGYLRCVWFGAGVGLGYDGGSGNPGDSMAQYGWHVELLEEAADYTWATVRIWNSMYEVDDELAVSATKAKLGQELTYTYDLKQNIGSPIYDLTIVPLDISQVAYVPGSATGGAIPLPAGMPAEEAAALFAEGGKAALEQAAAGQSGEIAAIAWPYGDLPTGAGDTGFSFKVVVISSHYGMLATDAMVYNKAKLIQTTSADTVTIMGLIYLPVIMR